MSDIEVELKGEVAWIRLNRPERMNAYDAEMAQELIDAIEHAADSGFVKKPRRSGCHGILNGKKLVILFSSAKTVLRLSSLKVTQERSTNMIQQQAKLMMS